MKFKNCTIHKEIDAAIVDAEKLFLPDSKMMDEIRNKNDFAFNSGTGEEVYQKILDCKTTASVFTYRPLWRFTRAKGYSDGETIHLNIYKICKMPHSDIVGLLAHEILHLGTKFSHGSNFPSDYKNNHSVNYFVSSNIEKWL